VKLGRNVEDWQDVGFGLYLHWPFCESKCPYCDFNSHVASKIDVASWQTAFLAEIDRIAEEVPNRVLNTVFFGGGTPSLMDPGLVSAVLDRIRLRWPIANDIEITLEANPSSVEATRFAGYAAAGVNRVSLGVQALNDADLRRLGRRHSTAEALRAIEIAQNAFSRVSIDLIYARQDQTIADWQQELDQAIRLGTEHLSLYQLTIEENTVFGEMNAKGILRGLPDEDTGTDMYEITQNVCEDAGFSAYEVSNHARAGAESRHNLIYWRMGDYAGVGPGAHGRLTLPNGRWATEAIRLPVQWLDAALSGPGGDSSRQLLSATDRGVEYLMMSLRLAEGSSLSRYERLSGSGLDDGKLAELQGLGMIVVAGDRLQATAKGRLLLNRVIGALLGA
jgi:putative oxygen-independent coproporphyrinogen III oxidase